MEINRTVNSIYKAADFGVSPVSRGGVMRGGVILAAMVVMLSGCSSTANLQIPNNQSANTQSPNAQSPNAQAGSTLTQLPPQDLAAGECGLFVWSAQSERRFILFSSAQRRHALWHDGEAVLELSFEQEGGAQAYEQYPAQDYRIIGTERRLSLKLSDSEQVEAAMRFKSGRLTERGSSDWDKVIPVLGLATCQP